ncbi:MAG TPA: protein kinase [Anaeromyxobacteraceae bacterium]|nr:protein kinase [Anaeromyxobacteraceae bacterium]
MAPGALTALLGQLARCDEPAPRCRALDAGARVGRFAIVREIGRGGFGIVYEARDPLLGRSVALKLLRPERLREALDARGLVEEAEAAAQLQHPNVVSIHELGEHDGMPYLVLELLSGETLHDRLDRGALPVDTALSVAIDVSNAVAHAHARSLVHRDLKPANVFVCADGAVKVLDFGLSLFAATAAGASKDGGTPAYMCPEQSRGEPGDAHADVFAIGVMLHQMLCGELPYRVRQGSSDATRPGATPRLAARRAPHAVRHLVARCIDRDPRLRPRDAGDLLAKLRGIAAARARMRARRVAAAVVAATAVAGVAVFALWRGVTAPPREPVPVAIADLSGDGGLAQLDGLPTLLATALEPSHRLRVLPRTEVADDLRRASGSDVAQVEAAALLKNAAAVPAKLVLVPGVRRDGDRRLLLEVRALELASGADAFVVTARAADAGAVMTAIDELSDGVRHRLREPAAEIRASRVRIAEATTSSLDAYAAYHDALRCFDRSPSPDDGCIPLLERAVELDPEFALAHSEIAMRAVWMGRPLADVQAAMTKALRHSDRLPASDRLKLMAFAADLDGREADAAAFYQQATAAAPDDRLLLMKAADFFLTREEPDLALPFWRRVFELERVPAEAGSYLVFTLASLRRSQELRDLARRLEAGPGNTSSLIALAFARANLGDAAGALAAARSAQSAAITKGERAEALRWVVHLQMRSGDLGIEEELRRGCQRGWLRNLLSLEGRRRELRQLLSSRTVPGCPPPDVRAFDAEFGLTSSAARVAAYHGTPGLLRSLSRRSAELNSRLAAPLAVFLAYAGELREADALARPMYPGSPRRETYEAVVQWRRGDLAGARARLRTLFDRNPWTSPPPQLPPSYLYGELLAEMGDDEAAVEALQTFHSLDFPIDDFWTWAYPKSLYLLARSQERLGRVADARATIERLLALWSRADPDLPMLAAARALHARVVGAHD